MITIKPTINRDIHTDASGNWSFLHDQDAVSVVCESYARAARNEMIHKMNKGMPYFEQIFTGVANLPQFEAAFRERMSEIEEVVAITSFRAEFIDETIKYEATIQTIYGDIGMTNEL